MSEFESNSIETFRRLLPIAREDEEVQRLNHLMRDKGLTKDDLVLIFRCLKPNPECLDIFE